jgi:hypothetical protein
MVAEERRKNQMDKFEKMICGFILIMALTISLLMGSILFNYLTYKTRIASRDNIYYDVKVIERDENYIIFIDKWKAKHIINGSYEYTEK